MTQTNIPCHIGVDVSKAKLDVYCPGRNKILQYDNTPEGINKLFSLCLKQKQPIVACEATGSYHINMVYALQQKGLDVIILNPRQVRNFARALGRFEKTDRLDAQIIAEAAKALATKPAAPITQQQMELSALQTRKKQLTELIKVEKNHLATTTDASIKEIIISHLELLKNTLKALEDQVDAIFMQSPSLQQKKEILLSMKCVGPKTVQLLMIELPELGQLNMREIAKLVGVAPLSCDSGQMKGYRAIHGGRMSVRNALYMATLGAIRYNSKIKAFYTSLIQRGKKPKVAIVACMRKMLIILNTMLKNQQKFNSCLT